MTNLVELRRRYEAAYKIIKREREMREYVYRRDKLAMAQKTAEMDEVLATLVWMKDELKKQFPPEMEQSPLIELPRTGDY